MFFYKRKTHLIIPLNILILYTSINSNYLVNEKKSGWLVLFD